MEFTISTILPATPQQIYEAWLDSEKHSQMTGGQAEISDKIGERFIAWGGYIEGENVLLESGKKIIQSWRTAQFKDLQPNSLITITFEPKGTETEVKIHHEHLEDDDIHYKQGWIDHYFEPMKKYFG